MALATHASETNLSRSISFWRIVKSIARIRTLEQSTSGIASRLNNTSNEIL